MARYLERRISTVDEIVTAGCERCLIGEQEDDEVCYFFRLAETAERMASLKHLASFVVETGLDERGLDVAWADGVDS